jgi:hypothetical protein
MKYINTTTQEVSTDSQIKLANKNVSFSKVVDTFADLGWQAVLAAPKPTPSGIFKAVRATAPVQDANGNWVEGYEEVDMFSDTVEDGVTITKAEHEAAHAAKLAEKELKAALDVILNDFIAETEAIKTGYTQAEIDTFPTQEAEAQAWAADNTAPTPLLDAVISESGKAKADLVTKILGNAAAMKVAVGKAIGTKQREEKAAGA